MATKSPTMLNVLAVAVLLIPAASAYTTSTNTRPLGSFRTIRPSLNRLHRNTSIRLTSNNDLGDGFDINNAAFDPLSLSKGVEDVNVVHNPTSKVPLVAGSAALALLVTSPDIASAASSTPNAVPSALFAYGHYLSLLACTAAIMAERLMVKPSMTIEEENQLQIADVILGVAGVALLATGYYRAIEYGKGWAFYSHEPLFWLKMSFLGIFAGLTLFPTITFLQRTVRIQQRGDIEPMSEKLAGRLVSVMNAELSALAFIPLTATLMSRGVGHINNFPTEVVGPAFFGVITAGACFKYVKDALTWTED